MSTDYILAKVGPIELFAVERSARIEIGISRDEDYKQEECHAIFEEDGYADTGAIFSDDDIIKIIVNLLAVASYVADDAEQIRQRLHNAISEDRYLGSMPLVVQS